MPEVIPRKGGGTAPDLWTNQFRLSWEQPLPVFGRLGVFGEYTNRRYDFEGENNFIPGTNDPWGSVHRIVVGANLFQPVVLDHVGIFADGVAVRRVGDETFRLCKEFVDEIITVHTDQTCAAIRDIFEDTRSIVEPAGGLAVAGAKKYVAEHGLKNKTLVTISCGANVNFDRLRHIAERAAVGEQTEMLVAAEIPEQPGSFRRFCEVVGRRGITEFNYRYGDDRKAHIFVGIQLTQGSREREMLLAKLRDTGFPVEDLSDNEMAKLHVRHMVGGRAPGVQNERLFRFEFPERPGALLDFLNAIGTDWNISLFHYRNHGSDYGRILAGIDVPQEETADLEAHLAELGYTHWEESDNPAYKMFLG